MKQNYKFIRVNEELYEQIKQIASNERRSAQAQVEYLLSNELKYNMQAPLPRGGAGYTIGINPAYDETKFSGINETISKVTSGIVKKATKKQDDFASLGIRSTTESKIDLEKGKATITVKPNEEDVKAFKEKTYDFCKHDALKGFCKSGCK